MSSPSSTSTALVTGSSTGIGYATALRLARDGFHVVATMRSPDACDLFDVANGEGLSLETLAMDVTSDDSVRDVFADVLARRGEVDVLVANAGIGGRTTPLEGTTIDDFREVMETNLYGVLRCVYEVLPAMRRRRSGAIVAVSSQAGRFVDAVQPVYNSSKFALEAVMESLAVSVAPFDVRVALIEPGVIRTPIFGKGAGVDAPDPEYQIMVDAFMGMLIHDLKNGSDPDVVADVIATAVTTSTPHLRYLVGQGAERNIRVRSQMSDEEFVALHRTPLDNIVARRLDLEV